jgi:hypothetical protein
MVLRTIVFITAALLFAAHFLRLGDFVIVALCLCAPLLLLYRKRWVLIVLQIMAYGAAVGWILVAARLVEFRQQSGMPWKAAAIILGAVALYTLLAGLLLNSRSVRERYQP